MSEHQVIVSGFGGQGVMSLGKIMAQAAMEMGYNVSWLPSYGPEMRGGTANCSVVMSEGEIVCPIVIEATSLIAMNKPSLVKFEGSVKPGGLVLVNRSIVEIDVQRSDLRSYYIPCLEIATELGNPKVSNIVMLGAYMEATQFLKREVLEEMLKGLFAGKKASLIDINLKALEVGASSFKEAV